MPDDSYTEVTHQSWFGRMGESIKGVLVGLILFIAAFPLLFWNEGRAVTTQKSIDEGAAAVISISPQEVQQSTEGKLVHMSGRATTNETLEDPVFGVSANAIKLQRQVETYQWIESKVTKTKEKIGGGRDTYDTYEYAKDWRNDIIDSRRFRNPDGHQNPLSKKYQEWTGVATDVHVGKFHLSPGLIGAYNQFDKLPVTEKDLAKLPADLKARLHLDAGAFFDGPNPGRAEVGDTRIRYVVFPQGEVSLLAQQRGDSFAPYITQAGPSIERLETGTKSAAEMFREATSENTTMTWALRVLGFVLMWIGLSVLLRPIVTMGAVVPLLGDLLGLGVGLFTGCVALALSLTTMAVGWFAYRPVIAVILVAAGLGALLLLKRAGGKMRARKVAA